MGKLLKTLRRSKWIFHCFCPRALQLLVRSEEEVFFALSQINTCIFIMIFCEVNFVFTKFCFW